MDFIYGRICKNDLGIDLLEKWTSHACTTNGEHFNKNTIHI